MTPGPCPGDLGFILAILGVILGILGRILAILSLILAILGRVLASRVTGPGFFSRPKSIHFGREKKGLWPGDPKSILGLNLALWGLIFTILGVILVIFGLRSHRDRGVLAIWEFVFAILWPMLAILGSILTILGLILAMFIAEQVCRDRRDVAEIRHGAPELGLRGSP